MTWRDRLKEAAYTSPSGLRLTFDYVDVSRTTSKRAKVFEFSGVDGAYVQSNGTGARQYPLRMFFSGSDHDAEALIFEIALLESGVGRLEHPMYGSFDVVPAGDISRRDDLTTGANQTVIEATFFATLGAVYPQASGNAANELQALLASYLDAGAGQFAGAMDLGNEVFRSASSSTLRDMLLSISSALSSVSGGTLAVTRAFRSVESDINLGMDVLIGQPLQLAKQMIALTTLPGRAATNIADRLAAYRALADDIFASTAGTPAASLVNQTALPLKTGTVANDFHSSDMVASSAVAGSVVAVLKNTFTTRPDAIAAAEEIQSQFAALVTWRDAGFEAMELIPDMGNFQIDDGCSHAALSRAVALATGFLIEISFTLVPERTMILDRARTIVDLSAELYGDVDSRLDFLISSNDLTGSEILELPKGRAIVYYA